MYDFIRPIKKEEQSKFYFLYHSTPAAHTKSESLEAATKVSKSEKSMSLNFLRHKTHVPSPKERLP